MSSKITQAMLADIKQKVDAGLAKESSTQVCIWQGTSAQLAERDLWLAAGQAWEKTQTKPGYEIVVFTVGRGGVEKVMIDLKKA